MVLSKRERYIGIGVVGAVGFLLLNYIVISPLEDQASELSKQIKEKQSEVTRQEATIRRSRDLGQRWAEMTRNGIQRNLNGAQNQLYNAVSSWRARRATPPPALRSDRSEKVKPDFTQITLRGTGNGSMAPIARFLWHLQTANMPVRVTDITITSRREGTDDLALALGIATLYLNDTEAAPRGGQPAAAPAARETQE